MSRSELLIRMWQTRYVKGRCDLDEFEAGVERALSGAEAVAEWEKQTQGSYLYLPGGMAPIVSLD